MKELIELVLRRGLPYVMESTTESWRAGRANHRPKVERKYKMANRESPLSSEDKKAMTEMRARGFTWVQIGKKFNVCESTARRWVNGRKR